MSITSALNNAISGLTATSRAAQLVSSNMANIMTEGYGRREIELSAVSGDFSGGVKIGGVRREVNPVILADRRAADASLARADTMSNFMNRLEQTFGVPGEPGSLTGRIDDLEAALVSASSRPDSEPRLNQVLLAATNLTSSLNGLSTTVQDMRSQADKSIAVQVDNLNSALEKVQTLNVDIVRAKFSGSTALSLYDERQILIDQISEIVPVRIMDRAHGAVALVTEGGAIVLDQTAAEFGFTASNTITADMSLSAGTLSGLTINGRSVNPSPSGAVAGGRLEALFSVRDSMLVDAQSKVDALARDMIERFEDSAVDPSLAAGDPGLFTDNGSAFDPLLEAGIAGRISVNAAVDPDQGGHVWRLRDGINAMAQGNGGDSSILKAGVTAISTLKSPGSSSVSSVARTSSALASDILSYFGVERQNVERNLSFAAARQNELQILQAGDGVDSDQEMQKLLIIEQTYEANAKVIQVVDELIKTLIRL